jgi:hypothetical protein
MVKKKPAAQAKTAENETVKVETKAAEKTTAAEKEAVKEVAKEVVKETAAAEEAPAKAEEKPAAKAAKTTRTTAKKTTTKKAAAPKKPAAVKKPAEKKSPAKAAKKEAEQEMILQFGGREIKEKDLYERIQQIWIEGYGKKAEELKSLKVYVKPEEFTAYYVINDDVTGSTAGARKKRELFRKEKSSRFLMPVPASGCYTGMISTGQKNRRTSGVPAAQSSF